MPVKKGSIDKSFGKKFLDGAKKVGSYLPVANEYNIIFRNAKGLSRGALALIYGFGIGATTHDLVESKLTDLNQKNPTKSQYEEKIDSVYKSELGKCKSWVDSLNFYYQNDMKNQVKMKEPSFKEKERVVKSLDGGLVD